NESHHKDTKVAAKLTQKDIKTFEKQTSDRCDDFEVLDLAIQELEGRPLWDYFQGYKHPNIVQEENEPDTIGGMMYNVEWDDEENAEGFVIKTRMKAKDEVEMDTQLLGYLNRVQAKLLEENLVERLQVFSEHTRSGQKFRAHPNYRGKGVWRDWVMIHWQEGDHPAQIWGFLDLQDIPRGRVVKVDERTTVRRGVFAIVESANYVEEDAPLSNIFTPLVLDTAELSEEGLVSVRKFWLVDVEAFKDPIVVIPNVGTKDQYLLMKSREEWANDFVQWIEMPHKYDKIEMLPEPVEGNEEEE
ncbi:MAG: hypothetical protein LC687_07900, partial [Actinobacteria bacterium]|nr:hypothetical protein [Actinomycetota bacterium]